MGKCSVVVFSKIITAKAALSKTVVIYDVGHANCTLIYYKFL